jgi:short-subunit dehydrogenase
MRSAVIVGASTGVGLALGRELAREGTKLVLVARDIEDIQATASDLAIRFGVECAAIAHDIGAPGWDVASFAAECLRILGRIDEVFVTAGAISDDDTGSNPAAIEAMAAINFVGPSRVAATFGNEMALHGGGSLVLCSSIAAAAPRQRNASYSASKAALEVYAKALRADLERKGVRVLVVALGYVDTSLAFGLTLRLPVATSRDAARFILAHRGSAGRIHYPRFWFLATTVLRHLPWCLYRRLSF